MNKINKILLFIIASVLVLVSCRNEDFVRFPELKDGANVRVVVDPNASFFNFENLEAAKFVYDVYSSNTNIEKVDIFVYFVPINGDPQIKKLLETFTQSDFDAGSGKISRSYTAQQMVDFFGLGSLDNLQGGDAFNFRNETTLADGSVYSDSTIISDAPAFGTNRPGSITTNIIAATASTSFTSSFSTFVGCPSNLAGNYKVLTTATSTDGCCPTEITVEYETVITQTGATNYTLTDFSSGTYAAWYCAPYGLCSATFEGLGATALDVCGSISLAAGYWGSKGSGSVDEATGVITIQWSNVFGDGGTSVLTPL